MDCLGSRLYRFVDKGLYLTSNARGGCPSLFSREVLYPMPDFSIDDGAVFDVKIRCNT